MSLEDHFGVDHNGNAHIDVILVQSGTGFTFSASECKTCFALVNVPLYHARWHDVESPVPEKSAPSQEYHTVREVALMLRMSKMSVYRMVHAGDIPSFRVGNTIRIPIEPYKKWREGNSNV